VVGVIETAVVCADDRGTRALGLDGKPRWKTDAKYVAMTDGRVVVAGVGEAIVAEISCRGATGSRAHAVSAECTRRSPTGDRSTA